MPNKKQIRSRPMTLSKSRHRRLLSKVELWINRLVVDFSYLNSKLVSFSVIILFV